MHPNSNQRNQPRAQPERMVQYNVTDEQKGGLVVSTFAHPSEWRAGSKVVWNMQHTNVPALVHAIALNPERVESFEFLPMQAFAWIEGDLTGVRIGQNRHGLVRMPPRSALDALVQLIIPSFRGDRQNLRIVGVHPVANLWQATNDPPPQQQAEGVVARIEYEEQGRAIEEEFYGVCQWVPVSGALNWGFGRPFCFRAERGQINAMRETFWGIAASLRPNPQWGQLYEQTIQQLMSGVMATEQGHRDRIAWEGEIGRRNIAHSEHLRHQRTAQVNASVAQTQREISDRSQQHFTPQEAFGYLLRDQTPFHDPNSVPGNYHVVQGSFRDVWTDNQGNFQPTHEPTDNPNHDMPGHWVHADPVKVKR